MYLVYHSVSAFFIKADCLFIRTESYILESHHFCAYVKFRYRPEFIFIFSPRNTIRKIKMIEIFVFTASKHICQKYFNRQKPVSLKSLVPSAVHRISHIFQDFQIIGVLFLLRSPAHFSSEYFFRIFSLSIAYPQNPPSTPKICPVTNFASTRYLAALATSSGLPIRPREVDSANSDFSSSVR